MQIITLLSIGLLPLCAIGQAGSLDPSFGGDGLVTTPFAAGGYGCGVLVQPDDKVVVAGVESDGIASGLALVRYLPDGSLDPSFGNNGIAIPSTGADVSFPKTVLQPDGRIIVVGSVLGDITVWRFTTDGQLDPSFGTGGSSTVDLTGTAQNVALQADGGIVVVGTCEFGGIYRLTVLRFLPNGILDPGFSDDGLLYTVIGNVTDGGNGIAIQPDGRIVAAGSTSDGSFGSFVAVRYLPDGMLDPSFGTNGVRMIFLGGGMARDVLIQPDGKIVLGGNNNGLWDIDHTLVRLEEDGSIDNTFSEDGVLMVDGGGYEGIISVALQADGKIIGAGVPDLALLRVSPNGEPDVTFGGNGLVMNPLPGNAYFGQDLALQPDGRILLTGQVNGEFAVVRILNDPDIGIEDRGFSHASMLIRPNPVHDIAWMEYDLVHSGAMTCTLLDAQGRTVRTLFSHAHRAAGKHREPMDLAQIASGSYRLVLSNGETEMTGTLVKQ